MALADRVAVMRDGAVQQAAAPLELYQRPANRFVAGFIGAPAMNFFTGVIERKNGSLLFRAQDGAGMAVVASSREGPVVLGLRPEHISFAPTENSQTRIEALVERVETTGSESLVYLSRGGAVFAARAPANFHAPACRIHCRKFRHERGAFF